MILSLKKCIFEQLVISTEVLDAIAKRFREVTLNTGEFLIEPGEVCKNTAFISGDSLRLYNVLDGKEITL